MTKVTRNGRSMVPALAALLAAGVLDGQTANPNVKVVPSEVVILRKDAVEPQKITRPAGPFALYLENRTGKPNETFRLDPEPQAGAVPGTATALVTFATQEGRWWNHALIDLPPGTYRLSLRSRADLTLQLVITK